MAENLWALREQKKLSIATLASRAGLAIGLIMEYESGQRSIESRHLSRIARALYVEESQLKLRSDPRPGAAPLERRTDREPVSRPAPPSRPRERPVRSPQPEPRPPGPARPSQIAHLNGLLQRLKRTPADLEAEIGKPVAELDRLAIGELLTKLQAEIEENSAASPNRRRAYLPESVDEYEASYLIAAQAAGDRIEFSLFDGRKIEGVIIGFSPYSITARLDDGSELTLNKLALVYYRRLPVAAPGREEPTR